jgi:hypothetical protein
METGRIRRSQVEMRRTLLAWVPGKGLETGEVRRWRKSQSGVVIVKEMFWRMNPTVPMLVLFSSDPLKMQLSIAILTS